MVDTRKPISDAKKWTLHAYTEDDSGKKTDFLLATVYCEGFEAARIMADAVIRELGDGDGENGGLGSLKNCYGDIFNSFLFSGHYEYADCRFTMTAN